MKKILIISMLLIFLAACAPQAAPPPPVIATKAPVATDAPPKEVPPTEAPTAEPPAGGFSITSERFTEGQPIPEKYTCDDQNVSPALAWTNPPRGTETLALIMDDPDAPMGTWVHWVLYNIPADVTSLPDVLPGQGGIAYIGSHGINTAGNTYYEGPCPPSGTHRYFFKLYALDTALDFTSSPDAAELTVAMQGHILAETQLMGTYAH